MTLEEFLEHIDSKAPPAPEKAIRSLESDLGGTLPDDYRAFLVRCNGGFCGGSLWFKGPTPEGEKADAGVHHIGGFRRESYFSIQKSVECYKGRISSDLLWIMDDPFGNAICLGVKGPHQGKVFFWDHEEEPDPDEWDGGVETAGNVSLLANSFSDFVAGLQPTDEVE